MPKVPVRGKCRLTLTVTTVYARGTEETADYSLHFLQPHPAVASMAIRLVKEKGGRKAGSSFHDIAVVNGVPSCDCGDFTFRGDTRGPKGCKHIASLRAVGILPPLPTAT